ncbi:MAG: amidophosphoribosyltransferase [Myxococcota bacterium]
MCGIVGLIGQGPVNIRIYDALTVLQHRGQDAAGIATIQGDRIYMRKNNGLVKDVFRTRHMHELIGSAGIGHVRYPTAGRASSAESQPFYVNAPYGIVLGHNGNLTNADTLRRELSTQGRRHLNTESDSEVLLNLLASELEVTSSGSLKVDAFFDAVSRLHARCRGAYAVVGQIPGFGMFAFRDPLGIRPLVFGAGTSPEGHPEHMVASESVALDVLGFDLTRDIAPGEAVVFLQNGEIHSRQCSEAAQLKPCLFELVYLARPDSLMDGISVYKSRLRMGDKLANKLLREWPDHDIDVVIPVPDTSRTAALQMAHHLGVKYREGFIKNRYIGRTFIMPGQQIRKKSVRQKLNPIGLEFRDKNVLLVDDSIVRGTTSSQIIQMARDAGANKVYVASAAPPVRYPNVYGIDMPSSTELIAHGRTEDEIRQAIGADRLFYQDLKDLRDSGFEGNPEVKAFEESVFSGQYITGDVDSSYLQGLEDARSDGAKQQKLEDDDLLGDLDVSGSLGSPAA